MADNFETALSPDLASDEQALIVDVEGFEGPLDLLLTLARQQKVDLAKISILALADQYLAFIEEARKIRLELAADYLVMAAWLAYLKSRLLIPVADGDLGPSAEDMATALAAGCDMILHCNGRLDEMQDVAGATPPLAGEAARRADAALSARRKPAPLDVAAAREEFAAMGVSA